MRSVLTPFTLVLLAACGSPATPDDRVIEVISETEAPENTEVSNPEPADAPEASGETNLADIELCDAKDYRHLVGQNAGGTQFPVGPKLRVFGENDIITQELRPERTNIVADNSGKIVRVYCG